MKLKKAKKREFKRTLIIYLKTNTYSLESYSSKVMFSQTALFIVSRICNNLFAFMGGGNIVSIVSLLNESLLVTVVEIAIL